MCLVVIDSMGFNVDDRLEEINKWMGTDASRTKTIRMKVPQQPNSNDCGLYTLKMLDYFMLDLVPQYVEDFKEAFIVRPL